MYITNTYTQLNYTYQQINIVKT